jgi:hypothetical protein
MRITMLTVQAKAKPNGKCKELEHGDRQIYDCE